jgi:hypothetical protein
MRVFVGWPSFYNPLEPTEPNQGVPSIDKYHEPWFNALAKIDIQKFSTNFSATDMQSNLEIFDQNIAIIQRVLLAIYGVKSARDLDMIGKKTDPEEDLKAYVLNAFYQPWTNSLSINYMFIAAHFK